MPKYEFCIPTVGKAVPAGAEWFHEVKYDGYRLRVERDGRPRPPDHPRRP
jgi:bifunctional non-homologous end joining protein LigD